MPQSYHKWVYPYLFIAMSVSFFVLIEPSPYDLLMIVLLPACFLWTLYRVHEETIFPHLLVGLFLICNLVSLFFVKEIFIAFRYSGITFYLAISWLCLVGLGQRFKLPLLQVLSKGYLVGAVLAVVIGIVAYFNMIPMSDHFLLFGRVKSTFKDPNVFGPFLVMPALFAISIAELSGTKMFKKIIYLLCFLLLSTGIILSYSRAAWGNFAISLLLYLLITKRAYLKNRMKTIIMILIIGVPCLIYFIQTPLVQDLLVSRLMIKGYDSDRFSTQREAFDMGVANPLGIGPGQSESTFQYAPHSLYARIFTENGLLGLLSYVFFLASCLYSSFQKYWQSTSKYSVLFLVIFSSLAGLIFNSLFIDTLHWRHLWVISALALFPVIQAKDQTGETYLSKGGVL